MATAEGELTLYSAAEFDPWEHAVELIDTDATFPTLLSSVEERQKRATGELQKLVFSNYRNYLHISAAVRVVLRDIAGLKSIISETKQTISAIGNCSYVPDISQTLARDRRVAEEDDAALDPQRAILPAARAIMSAHAEGAKAEDVDAQVRAMQDEISQGLIQRDYDAVVGHLMSFVEPSESVGSEPAILQLETTVVQRLILEFYSLPPMSFHLQQPLIDWLQELGYNDAASACFLDGHSSWINVEIGRVIENGTDAAEFIADVTETLVALLQHGMSRHRQLFGADPAMTVARANWAASHVDRTVVHIISPVIRAAFAEYGRDCSRSSDDGYPSFFQGATLVFECIEHVHSFACHEDALLSQSLLEAMIPTLIDIVGDYARHVESSMETLFAAARDPQKIAAASGGAKPPDASTAGSPTGAIAANWEAPLGAGWGELYDDILRIVAFPKHGAAYSGISGFFEGASMHTQSNLQHLRALVDSCCAGRALARGASQVLCIMLHPRTSLHSGSMLSPLYVDVVDAGMQQVFRSLLFGLRELRDSLQSCALNRFLDAFSAIVPRKVRVQNATPNSDRPAHDDGEEENIAQAHVLTPERFVADIDLMVIGNLVTVLSVLQITTQLFPLLFHGMQPTHCQALLRKGSEFVHRVVADAIEKRSPLSLPHRQAFPPMDLDSAEATQLRSSLWLALRRDGGGPLLGHAPWPRVWLLALAPSRVKNGHLAVVGSDRISLPIKLSINTGLNLKATFRHAEAAGGVQTAVYTLGATTGALIRSMFSEAFWTAAGVNTVEERCEVLPVAFGALLFIVEPLLLAFGPGGVWQHHESLSFVCVAEEVARFLSKLGCSSNISALMSRIPNLPGQHQQDMNPSGEPFSHYRNVFATAVSTLRPKVL